MIKGMPLFFVRPAWLIFAVAVCCSCALSANAALQPVDLRCEALAAPLGVDVAAPRLSWRFAAGKIDRNKAQTAYRILAASSAALLARDQGDLWDSGRGASAACVAVPYGGKAPASLQRVFWKVRAWDEMGQATDWSVPASWTTGKLKPEEWSAQWIAVKDAAVDLAGVELGRAVYRTLDGKVSVDVTETLRRRLAEKRLPFKVEPGILGGDPAVGAPKELVADYSVKGKAGQSRAADFEVFSIPQAASERTASWFRGEFELPSAPESALVTVQAPCYFELYVNGGKAGGEVLMPAAVDTRDLTFVVTFDVARRSVG